MKKHHLTLITKHSWWFVSLITFLSLKAAGAPALGAAPQTKNNAPPQARTSSVPFERIEDAFLSVPVRINDSIDTDFILDTGVGVTIVDKAIADRLNLPATGKHQGRRMSGQVVRMNTSSASAIAIGDTRLTNTPIAVMDLKSLLPNTEAFSKVGGFISLHLLKETPFTIDYGRQQIRFEDNTSLESRRSLGKTVPIKVLNRGGIETSISLLLSICDKHRARVEVDTGSQGLVLSSKYFKLLGIDPNGQQVKRKEGKDETGHSYTRYFADLPCRISLAQAAEFNQTNPSVMFQKIIYDGLVGDTFLRQFEVTYDLPHAQMIFSKLTH